MKIFNNSGRGGAGHAVNDVVPRERIASMPHGRFLYQDWMGRLGSACGMDAALRMDEERR